MPCPFRKVVSPVSRILRGRELPTSPLVVGAAPSSSLIPLQALPKTRGTPSAQQAVRHGYSCTLLHNSPAKRGIMNRHGMYYKLTSPSSAASKALRCAVLRPSSFAICRKSSLSLRSSLSSRLVQWQCKFKIVQPQNHNTWIGPCNTQSDCTPATHFSPNSITMHTLIRIQTPVHTQVKTLLPANTQTLPVIIRL